MLALMINEIPAKVSVSSIGETITNFDKKYLFQLFLSNFLNLIAKITLKCYILW